ncbi:MAG: hypothetical protein LCH56_05990 [Proteobacteria bacterium]|nr:hypothetical protein [Pseudomonadota bacterium]
MTADIKLGTMTWKRLDVSPDIAATLKLSFVDAFDRAGRPRNAALFEVAAADGVRLYLSPGAAVLFETLLKVMTTTATGAPPPDATLVAGDAETWGRG